MGIVTGVSILTAAAPQSTNNVILALPSFDNVQPLFKAVKQQLSEILSAFEFIDRTAYDLARTREVRDVFRRAAGDMPDKWDWLGAGHVPSALTRDAEDAREEKKKLRRKGLKEKIKEREAREKERGGTPEPEPEPAPVVEPVRAEPKAGPRKLGGTAGAVEGVAGLTPEMRAKVERERRARAAEARLKSIAGR